MWLVLIGALVLIGVAWVKWQNRDGEISVEDWAGEIAEDAGDYVRGTARRVVDAQRDYWNGEG